MNVDDTRTHDPDSAEQALPRPAPGAETLEARYRIDRVIASGGMGVVVAATHRHLGTRVAIKLLHDVTESMAGRFLREAKLAATLASPYVARVLDYGFSESGQPFIVMDYVEGRTLKARVSGGAEPPAEALRLARELATAVAEVHRAGIVHRDIKPANILLERDAAGVEHVKLIDFGIAKRIGSPDAEADITGSGEVLGTVSYMAPEQLARTASVDLRADVFALGVVVYEMLSGRRAFEDSARAFKVAMAQGRDDVPFVPLETIAPGCDDRLVGVVTRCLSVDPNARFKDASDMLAALPASVDAALAVATAPASAQAAGSARPLDVPKLLRWAAVAALVAGVATLAAIVSLRDPAPTAASGAAADQPSPPPPPSAASALPVPAGASAGATVSSAASSVESATAEPPRPPAGRPLPVVRPKSTGIEPRFDERQ